MNSLNINFVRVFKAEENLVDGISLLVEPDYEVYVDNRRINQTILRNVVVYCGYFDRTIIIKVYSIYIFVGINKQITGIGFLNNRNFKDEQLVF